MIFSRVIVSLIVPNSCLFFRIRSACDDCGSFCFMYRVCSLYLYCRLRFDCPMYENLHVLQVNLHSPLLSWSYVLWFIFGFVSVLKAIVRFCIWICLWFSLLMEDNLLILPSFSFLVVHYLSGFCRYICFVWWFSCCMSVWWMLLFFASSFIVANSLCFLWGTTSSECILVMWCLYAAILCSIGWFEKKLIVVSMEVIFRYMSISSLLSFLLLVDQKSYTVYSFVCGLE